MRSRPRASTNRIERWAAGGVDTAGVLRREWLALALPSWRRQQRGELLSEKGERLMERRGVLRRNRGSNISGARAYSLRGVRGGQ